MSNPELRRFEASVLQELESFVLEARGARALAGLGPDASLERDLGLGSLERVELLSRLESRFRRTAPERTLGEAETARDLAKAFLEAPVATREPAEIREPSPSEPRERRLAPIDAGTLTRALQERARRHPELPHIYLKEDGRPEETVSYGELYRDALLVASALRARGIPPGDRVAIMLPTCRAFFSTFMGALLAGGVPVPLYPPFSRAHIGEYAERQAAILRNAEARFFVTVPEGLAVGSLLRSSCPSLAHVLSSEEALTGGAPREGARSEPTPSDPALIQYTSGSTGEPKGVLLSHENLIANIRAIGAVLRIGPSDVGVSWLPLYHDMGLIGAWLTPLYFGIPVAILSPVAFLTRPHRWLWTIHRRRGTISPAPNFAYELAARKIDERDIEGLDLGSWRVALNGAEPVSPSTLERFAKKFGPHGFRPTSFLPVYGLAEASLLLATPALGSKVRIETLDREAFQTDGVARPPDSSHAEPIRFVSAGKVIPGHELLVVDEAGRRLPERREGRLLFRGPSVTRGYFRNEVATRAIRRDDGFLDSGDRAFLAEGELFLTGRAKDLIIKAGRNLVPQELEEAASGVAGVRAGSVAAFGVDDPEQGTERIVVVVECREETEEAKAHVEREVGRRITDLVGIAPDEVVVLPPRALPKTSSGKIRRNACRDGYLRGELGRRTRGSFRVAARLVTRTAIGRATDALERLFRLAYGGYVFVLTAGLVLPTWVLVRFGLPRGPLRAIVRRGSRLYLRLAGIPFEVRGREILERIPRPAILVGNHASYLDPVPVMAALDLDYAFVVKIEAFSWPFIGRTLDRLEHVPVERARADESVASTERMKAELARGRSLVLFPEGTFTRSAGLRPFKLGAFQLAAESGVPLVPLALVGTRRLLRDGTWIPKRVAVRVEIGRPIQAESGFRGIVRARDEAAETISRLSGEPRVDLVAAGLEYS